MPKVWCASIECAHNKKNQCTLKEINLSESHVHTVHDGFVHFWKCRAFSKSKEAAEMEEMIRKAFAAIEQGKRITNG